jgi:hypothetical protein
VATFKRAVSSSPDFFPSAARVRECAEAANKTAQLPRAPARELLDGKREYVPAIGAGHEEWVAEGANEGERLARLWHVESKHHGWDRGVPMPEEVGKRRFQELSVLISRVGSKTAATSGSPPTGSALLSTASGSSASPQSRGSSAGGLSHGGDCVCELCMPKVMRRAGEAGLL